jgi:hypothetical protein
MKIPLGAVVRGRQIPREKDMQGHGLGKGFDSLLAGLRQGVDVIAGKIDPGKQGHACHVQQDERNDITNEFDVFSGPQSPGCLFFHNRSP